MILDARTRFTQSQMARTGRDESWRRFRIALTANEYLAKKIFTAKHLPADASLRAGAGSKTAHAPRTLLTSF